MKKNESHYCKKHPGEPCVLCGSQVHDANHREPFHSTLYAAEFMLYAFHFELGDENNALEQSPAHPLMMLVAEG